MQDLRAVQRIANALQRTGADKPRGFADQKRILFAADKIRPARREEYGAFLAFHRRAELKIECVHFLFQRLIARLPLFHRVRTAKNKIAVFADAPGIAVSDAVIKNAGVKRHRVLLRKPLLDGDIFTDLMIGIKMAAHQGVRAVSSHQIAGSDLLLPAVGHEHDLPAIAGTADFPAQAVMMDHNIIRDKGFHP
ncbi:MAG: hypothetical protein K0R86_1235 [Enterobacter kobei]|nr:hypothetical protein [Enterobacter kobei]